MHSVIANRTPLAELNPWELRAWEHQFPKQPASSKSHRHRMLPRRQPPQDPMIYPGLYSGTGFDLMKILFHVMSRPNPQIDLGPVDCSVSLIVCDLDQPDTPTIYATEAFCEMTGYSIGEILGRNCRFLQSPPEATHNTRVAIDTNKDAVARVSAAVASRSEIQQNLINFRKNGQQFTNMLSLVHIYLEEADVNYSVGFAVEVN